MKVRNKRKVAALSREASRLVDLQLEDSIDAEHSIRPSSVQQYDAELHTVTKRLGEIDREIEHVERYDP